MGLEKLLESGLLTEESKAAIQEAWDAQLSEAREHITAELREEFAERYEFDKSVMTEAADKMFTESLEKELTEFREERAAMVEAKVKYTRDLKDHMAKLDEMVEARLEAEIKELHEDRVKVAEGFKKLEQFSIKVLESEIGELQEDRRALTEAKVKLVSEANEKINEARKQFISRAAIITESAIESSLRNELNTFREDIKEARENNFGRKMFEAFASEFMSSHYSRDKEIAKLQESIAKREAKLNEAIEIAEAQAAKVSEVEKKAKLIESRLLRQKELNELLAPLSKSQRSVMESLLEGVQTNNLRREFKKHVDFVINENEVNEQEVLRESSSADARREVTGNKERLSESVTNEKSEVANELSYLRKLAGI